MNFKDSLNLNKKYNLLNLEKCIPKQNLYSQLSQYKRDDEDNKISELKEYIDTVVIPNMIKRTKVLKRNLSFKLPQTLSYNCNKDYILSYFKDEGISVTITGSKVYLDWSKSYQNSSNSNEILHYVLDKKYRDSIHKSNQDINLEIKEYIETVLLDKMKEGIQKEKEYIIISLPKRFRQTLYKKALIESLQKENIYSTIERLNKLKIVVCKSYDTIVEDSAFSFRKDVNDNPLTSDDAFKLLQKSCDTLDFIDRIVLFMIKVILALIVIGTLDSIKVVTSSSFPYNRFCVICAIIVRDISKVVLNKVKHKKSLELLNRLSSGGSIYILDEWNLFCRKLLYVYIVLIILIPTLMLLRTGFYTLITYAVCAIIIPAYVNISLADTKSADYNLI